MADTWRDLERALENMSRRTLPSAIRDTLNEAAFRAMRFSRQTVATDMTNRNRRTVKSIRFNQATGTNIDSMKSAVGSKEDYMRDQEHGAVKRKTGRHGVVIPTGYSAGQQGQRPRTRLPRGANKMRRIELGRRARGNTRKQTNKLTFLDAVATGKKFVYMDLGRRKGVFKVLGGRRRPKARMVADLSNRRVRIPKNEWLAPNVRIVRRSIPAIYESSLRQQIRRIRG